MHDTTDDTNDEIETPDRIDVSEYKTAHGAAKATYEALCEWAEVYGGSADEVQFYDIEQTKEKRGTRHDCYCVSWEAGPYEWAPALTGGMSLTWNEFGGSADPEISGLLDSSHFGVECHYSFDLLFFNR